MRGCLFHSFVVSSRTIQIIYNIKKLKRILFTAVAVVFIVYASSLLLRIDAVQHRIARYISNYVQNIEHISLTIEGVSVRHFNKIDINGILLKDLSNDTLASIKRLTVHASPIFLLQEEVRINTITLEEPRVNITRETADSETNIQFILDLLAGNDSTPSTTLPHIKVGQVHIYDGKFAYNVKSEPLAKEGVFSSSHINIENIAANISLKKLNNDTLNLYIRRVSGNEASGLTLKRLRANISASKSSASLTKFSLELPYSNIEIPSIEATYTIGDSIKFPSSLIYKGEINGVNIDGRDIAAILPIGNKLPPISFKLPFKGNEKGISIGDGVFTTSSEGVSIKATLSADNIKESPTYKVNIASCNIRERGIDEIGAILPDSTIAQEIKKRLGNLSLRSNIVAQGKIINGTVDLTTGSGKIKVKIATEKNGEFNIESSSESLNIGRITDNNQFGHCSLQSTTSGNYIDSTHYSGETRTVISSLQFNERTFAPIIIGASLDSTRYAVTASTNDEYLSAAASFTKTTLNGTPYYTVSVTADSIMPHSLGLTRHLKESKISFDFTSELSGEIPDHSIIKANLYNFKLQTPQKYWKIRHIHIADNSLDEQRKLFIDSDIANGYIMGYYSYNGLTNSFARIIEKHLPALGFKSSKTDKENNLVFDININNSEILSHILNLPFCIKGGSRILGSIDDNKNRAEISASLNNTTLMSSNYSYINIKANADNNIISYNGELMSRADNKKRDSNDTKIEIKGEIAKDTLQNSIEWLGIGSPVNKGNLQLDLALARKESGLTHIVAQLHPSIIIYNDSAWNISKSHIEGEGKHFKIDNFALHNNNRQLKIDGVLGTEESDSLNIVLNKIDLEELLNIINFRSIDFGGKASGNLNIARIFDSPSFSSNLEVENFTFQKGRMGWLSFDGNWDEENKAILLNGRIYDGTHAHCLAQGFVSPANDTLDISVHTDGARIEFLNNLLSSFLDNVDGRAKGQIHIRGRMKDVNLYGALCPSGSLHLKPTNTTYNLLGDTVYLTRNRISFNDVSFSDRFGNRGKINGAITHNSLKNFGCRFDIKADNLLAYEEEKFGDNGFYGTAFITGDAHFIADDNGISLSAEIETDKNSKFVYNAAGPEGATDNRFVTFTDRRARQSTILADESTISKKDDNDILSRLRLDFMINATPGMQLRVYTNTITDDYIDIYGSGPINAVYDEKEGFSMKGNLNLTRGTYKFTMQNVFPKEFSIQQGSTLAFNGDPFLANLNLKTIYTVPSVPLTDLSISAERRKNVKVNCLMDITGTLQSPNLTFGVELPDGNEEERELLASATSTPEQTNMQFIYLIGIGKFYTYDYNNQETQSQSSTVMESLISSTISGQLNNMLSQITDNNNWDFSGNFTTSEKGWNSMEVEGMLSGRLLDNRLLINSNFGYRDNPIANNSFIGDFDVQWILNKSGNISLKAYNKTNDRYFSRTTLTTQGVGILLRHDFDHWLSLFKRNKKEEDTEEQNN